MPTILKPPVTAVAITTPPPAKAEPQKPRPSCVAELEADGTLVVTFTISPEMAKRFSRNLSPGHDMADYVWNARGLRFFEQQPII